MPVGIFASAIFLSAFLLFWVQPLFSKMVLPFLGGSPSVWNTAMMFFQIMLLAGYGYAHQLTRRIGALKWQLLIHGAVVGGGLLFLPFAISHALTPPTSGSPIFWLVGLLAVSVGWPFFALSASAPLLQAWFARGGHRHSGDPYFLYVASNSGSLLALLAFPILLEPAMTLVGQGRAWAWGYAALFLVLIAAGMVLLRANERANPLPEPPRIVTSAAGWGLRLTWILLAFIPSSLLLGVTTYITTDIASAPLLWVIPLALYLLSFIIAFSRHQWLKPQWTLKAQAICILVVSVMVLLALVFSKAGPVVVIIAAHLLTFFVTAVICHTELARRRPSIDGLTAFYFCMSIGGALGGIFNALLAPLIFASDTEYYLALVGACALRAFAEGEPRTFNGRDLLFPLLLGLVIAVMAWQSLDASPLGLIGRIALLLPAAVALYSFSARPFRLALGVAAALGAAVIVQGSVDVLHTERNFFGINKVKRIEGGRKLTLIHGTTMHGTEFSDPAFWSVPLAYYARSGPVGQLLALAGARPKVAVIGLGTGAMACYRKPGEAWTFYEIDGAVERIARDTRYFHYLQQCGAGTHVQLGDGRLSLAAAPDRSFDLIVIDAFSSDSIPMHLLTREAIALYLRKLTPHGVIVLHVSNEYLNLVPVLNTMVTSLGVAGRHQIYFPSAAEIAMGASASDWMAIAARDADFDFLAPEKRWQGLSAARDGAPWTDDFSNIFHAIKW